MRFYLFVMASFCVSAGCHTPHQNDAPVDMKLLLDSTVLEITTVATGLEVPWEIAWGPDDQIWITEQKGVVSKINPGTGHKKVLLNVPGVYKERTLGLLGMAIYPDFDQHPFVFFVHTFLKDSSRYCRVIRYTYLKDSLVAPLVLLDNIPGNTGHNGSRITITPDKKLIMSTGDALDGRNAQNIYSLNGKILRINIDGTVPDDNPFPGNPVWSLGHRNVQGLVYSPEGMLFSSEHGDATDDEINRIEKGKNYGWPIIQGHCDREEEKMYCDSISFTNPIKSWTPCIAPAGLDYYYSKAIPEWENTLLLTTLKNSSLHVLKPDASGRMIAVERVFLDHIYGRLRDVCVSPSGDIYLSTSNRDWNPGEGFPKEPDDRIIRIAGKGKKSYGLSSNRSSDTLNIPPSLTNRGSSLYTSYCASCHKENGEGINQDFPPLKKSNIVNGNTKILVSVVLRGLTDQGATTKSPYTQPMPSFSFLEDEEIAKILTYVRAKFNNNSNEVTGKEVEAVRKNMNQPKDALPK